MLYLNSYSLLIEKSLFKIYFTLDFFHGYNYFNKESKKYKNYTNI
jgi:hypothetical protein